MSEYNSNDELNEVVEDFVEDASVITVPIDDTLSHSGEAADAAAVGAALAEKADRDDIVGISVNGEDADAHGAILINAGDIPMDGSGTSQSVADVVGEVLGWTAEDIPMSEGGQSIADEVGSLGGRTGADIPLNGDIGADSVAEAVGELQARTAADIRMGSSDTTTIAAAMAGKLGPGDVDPTLAIPGKAADAAETGEALAAAADALEAVSDRLGVLEGAAVRSVNGELPGASGDVRLNEVPYAGNLMSDAAQASEDEYFARASGAGLSIADGDAWLMRISGSRSHVGIVEEVTEMTVHSERPEPEEGEDPETPITATIDWSVFKSYVSQSASYTFEYSGSAWNADLADYGITVSGTPETGDSIAVTYVKGNRGTITQSMPAEFRSTGWNLYNSVAGYARVVKYSETRGFRISGAYTSLAFSETVGGPQTPISVASGAFTVPGDGYVYVTGGSPSTTAIWMAHDDWGEGYEGDFEAYNVDVISLSSVMGDYFPYGLMQVGSVRDVIDLNTMSAINRCERLAYSESAIESLEQQGRAWEADENYIYAVLADPATHAINLDGAYVANDHGMEILEGGSVAPLTATMYGNNLKNKLERDVVTISQQALEANEKRQVRANIGAIRAVVVDMGTVTSLPLTMAAAGVTDRMVCVQAVLGTPSAQTGDWTVTTAADSVTISGTVASSGTTVKLMLVERDEVTATTPAN